MTVFRELVGMYDQEAAPLHQKTNTAATPQENKTPFS